MPTATRGRRRQSRETTVHMRFENDTVRLALGSSGAFQALDEAIESRSIGAGDVEFLKEGFRQSVRTDDEIRGPQVAGTAFDIGVSLGPEEYLRNGAAPLIAK